MIDCMSCAVASDRADVAEQHGHYLTRMRTLGCRTAELHRAFALPVDDPAFSPEKITSRDIAHWSEAVQNEATGAIAALRRIESSEERHEGKEGVSTCKSRLSPYR